MSPTIGAVVCRQIADKVRKEIPNPATGKYGIDERDLNTVAATLISLYPDDKVGRMVDEIAADAPDNPEGFATFCERLADLCEQAQKGNK